MTRNILEMQLSLNRLESSEKVIAESPSLRDLNARKCLNLNGQKTILIHLNKKKKSKNILSALNFPQGSLNHLKENP